MSICNDCYNAGTIPKCVETLTITETQLANDTEVIIHWEVSANGFRGQATGTVIDEKIVADEKLKFPSGLYINLWVVESGDQENQFQPLVINAVEYTCISFKVHASSVEVYDLSLIEAE